MSTVFSPAGYWYGLAGPFETPEEAADFAVLTGCPVDPVPVEKVDDTGFVVEVVDIPTKEKS